jgi:putative tryptophan/tyrosine transport system ATP-binding protein
MIDVESINRFFSQPGGDQVLALKNLTLHVPEGQFVTVIGTNGSGKSTLLNAIAGQFQVDSGTIRIAGRDVTRQPEYARAKLVGRVFQDPYKGTCPGLTIAENLRLAAQRGQRRGFGRGLGRDEKARYAGLLARFGMGLEERLEAQAGTLSGGQRQAVTLLMATISRPAILLLDEHTAALDPKAAEQIGSLTKEIVREQSLTTLMITHSMAQALALGDRTIMMHQGQIIADLMGAERRRARAQDLLDRFSALRRAEMLDDAMIRLIEANYL